jgi:hypothetical protein
MGKSVGLKCPANALRAPAQTFSESNGRGVHPDAKTRALRVLEEAGLIAIERSGKRSPRVTLIVELIVEEYAF